MENDADSQPPQIEPSMKASFTDPVTQPVSDFANNSQAGHQDEPLDIDRRLVETVEARRARCNAKAAFARSRLALRAAKIVPNPSTKSTSPTQPRGSTSPNSTTELIDAFAEDQLDPDGLVLKYGGSQMESRPSIEMNNDDPSEWPEVIPLDDEADASKFDAIKFQFDMILEPTMLDKIRFEKAKMEEEARNKRMADRKLLEGQDEAEEQDEQEDDQDEQTAEQQSSNDLFVPTQASSTRRRDSDDENPKEDVPPKSKRKQINRLSAEERRKSQKLGLDIALKRVGRKEKSSKQKRKATDMTSEPSKRSKKTADGDDHDLRGMIFSDVSKEAHDSAACEAMPNMTEKNKETAMTRLIASLPSDDQRDARSDKQRILDATKKFTHSARTDGQGGWKIKGLRSSLYHYQLQGAAFMRDRENQGEAPLGGLLCDMMGFGKTIQALANIVDGRNPDKNDPVQTTLIVVPSHLVTHWTTQIKKHCDKGAIGRIIVYYGKARLLSISTEDTTDDLKLYGVIITTYEEVRRSYPAIKLPKGLKTEAEITEWWNELYQEKAGPLHRIKFLRIILDEGHTIKNHLSSVSIAVRGLTAKYKWIISGTPVLNDIDEFYPAFDFLGVPLIGSYDAFQKKFCIGEVAQSRLINLLRAFLYRRTHASRLFSFPVIKMPDINEHIVETEFCGVERALYEAIQDTFINTINGLLSANNPKMAQNRCCLTMILKLRMFSSHTLTAGDIVKRLLTTNMMQKLNAIAKKERENGKQCSTKTVTLLNGLKKEVTLPRRPPQTIIQEQSSDELQGDEDTLTKSFRQFMSKLHEEEQWEERLSRTICGKCAAIPESPVITNCMHMYCEECYFMLDVAMIEESKRRVCHKCNAVIEAAARCGSEEDIQLDEATSSSATLLNQRSLSEKPKKKKKNKRTRKTTGMFTTPTEGTRNTVTDNEPDDDDDIEDEKDWVGMCGSNMPSAKLTKITEIVSGWIAENQNVKVVIFTQFLPFVQILISLCAAKKWQCACLTGKMSVPAREKSMDAFRENDEIRVLIASLKAGGTGLDMSVASKCIIVDLWWNEGVQHQAFCRLLRIGQQNNVEVVKLIVRRTIDDYMQNVQSSKTQEIDKTMGEDVLAQREGVMQLIEMFADITPCESGGIFITPKSA